MGFCCQVEVEATPQAAARFEDSCVIPGLAVWYSDFFVARIVTNFW